MSASSDSGSEHAAGSARQVATGRLPPADSTGEEVAIVEVRTVAIAPTRGQLATDMISGMEQAYKRARQMAELDSRSEEREQHLQSRTALAEKERDGAFQARDGALREADGLRLTVLKLARERDEALQEARRSKAELIELQQTPRRPLSDDVGILAGREAMTTLVKAGLISRGAEALRRRETTKALIGTAARERVYQAVTKAQMTTCRCYTMAQDTLDAGNLTDSSQQPEVQVHVEKVLRHLGVCQAVNLDVGPLADFELHETEDRDLVEKAIETGMANPATYRVVEDSLCLDARKTAQSLVKTCWLASQTLALSTAALTTHAPPVGRIETVSTVPVAGGSQDTPRSPAEQK
eukprot:GHVT01011958.1.p1 GENE.GHVT01011958.1~~GHVT01011958.1.p1  ORF type:complete len:352 (-),score=37.60 GHVT01011958.1:649-1704(-)